MNLLNYTKWYFTLGLWVGIDIFFFTGQAFFSAWLLSHYNSTKFKIALKVTTIATIGIFATILYLPRILTSVFHISAFLYTPTIGATFAFFLPSPIGEGGISLLIRMAPLQTFLFSLVAIVWGFITKFFALHTLSAKDIIKYFGGSMAAWFIITILLSKILVLLS